MEYLRPMTEGRPVTGTYVFGSGGGECERRAHERFNYYLPVRIRSTSRWGKSKDEFTCTINIASGGGYILSKAPWKLFEACEVTIWNREDEVAQSEKWCFRTRGVVVRIEKLDNDKLGSNGHRGVAVRFFNQLEVEKIAHTYLPNDNGKTILVS